MDFRPNLMDLVQHSAASSQGIKSMHPQGHSASITQQSSPYQSQMSQSLANMHTNTNIAHNYSNQHPFSSLSMSSGSPNFMNQSNQNADQTPPASNHPVANSSMSGQSYGFQKSVQAAPQLGTSQVSVHTPSQSVAKEAPKITEQTQPEKSQANGTVEEEQAFDPTPAPKEKSIVPTTPPAQNKVPEKFPVEETQSVAKSPPIPTTPTKQETAVLIQPSPVPDTLKISTPTKISDPVPVSPAKSDSEKASSHSGDILENEEDPLLITENDKLPSPTKQASNTVDLEKVEEPKVKTDATKPSEPSKVEPVQKETPAPKTPKATPVRKTKSKEQVPTPVSTSTPSVSSGLSSAKRQRMRTQHYQSPLPEVELVSKLSTSMLKSNDEKLMVFFKNEFLAVRNAESGFYLCQAVQNINKGSSRIKIRWLSQDKDKSDDKGEIYTPDFYDTIDFDCILTNLKLSKADKGKFMLPTAEKARTESILNRSIAVEKGEEISSSSLTEEHPDGLDVSLYREEDHSKKRKSRKRPRKAEGRKAAKPAPSKKSPEAPKVRKVALPVKKVVKKTAVAPAKPAAKVAVAPAKKVIPAEAPKPAISARNSRMSSKANSKPPAKLSPVVDQKKAKLIARIGKKTAVAAPAKAGKTVPKNAKVAKKPAVVPIPSTSSGKTAKAKANSSGSKSTSSRSMRKSARK